MPASEGLSKSEEPTPDLFPLFVFHPLFWLVLWIYSLEITPAFLPTFLAAEKESDVEPHISLKSF